MNQPPRSKLTLYPLVAAAYFMVAGGPYGLEELVAQTGFRLAIIVLVVTPLVWSLPTALMVGELAGALPEEGGYYAWVRRALGPFWGFMEAWLSLVASIFDMAIYPTLFALYLSRLWPALGGPVAATVLGAGMIAVCAVWNIRGAKAVGGGALVMTALLLLPFVILVALVPFSHATGAAAAPTTSGAGPNGLYAGVLVAMWNYMGWDNASTIAGEVDRPQRTYPLAMMIAVALVALTYVLPVGAMSLAGIDPSAWTTGSWVDAAEAVGGRALGVGVVLGGVICAFGMFNALVMSYSRLPAVLAEDGFLPRALALRHPTTDAPWVAIIACSIAWAAALRIGFARLVELDVMLYGISLFLEFVALVVLRLREPNLERPFRIPGGLAGAVAVGVGPTALIAIALWQGRNEQVGTVSALVLGGALIAVGPALFAATRFVRARLAVPNVNS